MNWHDYFTYNAETGDLIWKERPREHFPTTRGANRFNTAFAGNVAGNRKNKMDGRRAYVGIDLYGRHVGAHTIIWEMLYTAVPKGMIIDHIDGNPWNNRLINLRPASFIQNGSNRKISKNNTSGIKGVYRVRGSKTWGACIRVNGKPIPLGHYQTKGLAAVARAKGELRYFGKFSRLISAQSTG